MRFETHLSPFKTSDKKDGNYFLKNFLTKSHLKMCVGNYFLFQYKMFKYILRKRKEQEKHDRVPLLNDNEDDDNSQYNAIE